MENKYSKKSVAIHPKEPNYFSNGSGRDNYVSFNGGGFHKNTINYNGQLTEPGGFIPKKLTRKASMPRIQAKYQHYPPDGSGRDQYIITNEGGLCSDSTLNSTKPPNFFRSLRQYNKSESRIKPNDFLRRLDYSSQQQKRTRKLDLYNQQDLTEKLSSPKYFTEKVPVKTYSMASLFQGNGRYSTKFRLQ